MGSHWGLYVIYIEGDRRFFVRPKLHTIHSVFLYSETSVQIIYGLTHLYDFYMVRNLHL